MTIVEQRDSGFLNRRGLHWLALLLVLLLLGATVAYNLYTMRHQVVLQEQNRLLTQAKVIGKNIERQLGSIGLALNGIVQDCAQLCRPENQTTANKRLAVLADAMPAVRTLFITDANGTVTVANRPELVGQNFRHRSYFTTPQQHPDPSLLFISPPFKSVLGSYVFNITKVLITPDGRFNGVATAGFDPGYMYDILSSALYTQDMWNTINHGDGTRFMTAPHREGQAGKNLAVKGSLFTRHRESGRQENLFVDTAYATGEYRMAALLTVQSAELKMDYPLVVIISRSPKAILEGWRREALFQGGLYLLACIGSALGLLLLHRRQQSLEQQADQAQALVALRYQLLDYAAMHTSDELLQYALDQVCAINESPVGFYHFVDPDQQALTLQAWSTRTLQEFCRAEQHEKHYSVDQAGVWADCIQTRAPVIHNDYASLANKKELPPGHAPVIRELVVPVLRDERIVAVLGVGNKACDYTLRDAEEVTYLADVIWEIIDTRRSQQELAESRQQLADIFDFLPDATFVVDNDLKVVAWNRAMEEMSGIPKEQMIGQGDNAYTVPFYGERRNNLINLLDLDDEQLTSRYQHVARKGGRIFGEAYCPALYNGKGAHIWAVAAPLCDPQGRRVGVIEAIRDISRIKQLETELKASNELLAEQARIDFLTGIYNRRMFDSLMTAEIARSCRYGYPLSLLLMDLDHFKRVNDTLGHAAGDLVLQKLAELISGRIRSHDIFSRWGGEEFAILTPKCDEQQATVLAEVLRDMVEQYDFGNGLQLTISIGVTSHICGELPELFVSRADQALYQAKHDGRNRVCIQ